MQCVREYGVLNAEMIENIISLVKSDPGKLEKSQLYSAAKGAKFIDETERVSRFKKMRTQPLFDQLDDYVSKMSERDELFQFMLFRNDVTLIKYEEGGFFEEHEDYLSLKSNEIQEFTLLLCLSAQCQGGETVLSFNDLSESLISSRSVTSGHALLFRKDIRHRANRVVKGTTKPF